MAGSYYMVPPLPAARGKLRTFVEFFEPATEADALLILAMIATPAWGGLPGKRPAFLIQGPEHDPGRGVGKTTLADRVGDIYGGGVDVSLGEPIEQVKKRLLTPAHRSTRILRIDNVKTNKLSWGDLENLITTPVISGYQNYVGEATRPNTLTTFITVNGGSLSKDMAARVIPIRLARPTYRRKWESGVERFAKRYRLDILADLAEFFGRPPAAIPVKSRWTEWERQILGRLGPDPAAICQGAIQDERAALDGDDEDKQDLVDAFGCYSSMQL